MRIPNLNIKIGVKYKNTHALSLEVNMFKSLLDLLKINEIKFNKLVEVEYIIGEIILDLEIIIRIQNNYVKRHLEDHSSDEKQITPDMHNRVFYSFLFLSLYKYIELYEKYKDIIIKLL
jgi:hypothetical protein